MKKEKTVIIYDDPAVDCPVEPGHREKVLEHYDDFMERFGGPKDAVVLEGAAAAPVTKAVISLFRCGPSTSPCGPARDDHQWDAEVEITDGAGRVCGGSVACSRCGLRAIDFDIWNAP